MYGLPANLIGGIIGSIGGIAAGAFATWWSIRSTRNEDERKFMVQMATTIWLGFAALVFLPIILEIKGIMPLWVHYIGLVIYFIGLGPWLVYANKKLEEIRGEPAVKHDYESDASSSKH